MSANTHANRATLALLLFLTPACGTTDQISRDSGVAVRPNTLAVHPSNPRYFTDPSGKPLYLTGSHTWGNFPTPTLDLPAQPPAMDYSWYLDFLTQHGHNFMRLWASEDSTHSPSLFARTGPGKAFDGGPKFDLDQFDDAYFEQLRDHVVRAQSRGIYVSIMLFQGWSVGLKNGGHNKWAYHPFNVANNINGIDGDPNADGSGYEVHTLQISSITMIQEAYVRKVIDAVNDLDNVLYEISNESHGGSLAWQTHLVDLIHSYESRKPRQHPVGISALGDGKEIVANDGLFASTADWVSPRDTLDLPDGVYYSLDPPVADGKPISVLDTDHLGNNAAGLWASVKADRTWVWKAFLRGHNPIYMDPIAQSRPEAILSRNVPFAEAILSAREAMGQTLIYARRINLADMVPHGELASTGYALANPGSEYLIYQPHSGEVTVALEEGTYELEWFNPTSGETLPASQLRVTVPSVTLAPPFAGDAVIYLIRQLEGS